MTTTTTVKIPFLGRAHRPPLEIEVPANTPEVCRLRAAVEIAHKNGACLAGVDLDRADLAGAHLARANLNGAGLAHADLNGAHLAYANLTNADLYGTNLTNTDLAGANLTGAILPRRLASANLDRANLTIIRNDLYDVLRRAQPEVPGLLAALRDGRVDGSTYEGDCACLAGTIAHIRGVAYDELGFADSGRPIEIWFLAIKAGDTPDTSQVARITEGWIVEFQRLHGR